LYTPTQLQLSSSSSAAITAAHTKKDRKKYENKTWEDERKADYGTPKEL